MRHKNRLFLFFFLLFLNSPTLAQVPNGSSLPMPVQSGPPGRPPAIDFRPGDVIYMPRFSSGTVSQPLINSPAGQAFVNYTQRGEGADLLYNAGPSSWLWFRVVKEEVSLRGQRTDDTVLRYPPLGQSPFLYASIQCAYYIRTSDIGNVGTPMPLPAHFVQAFLSHAIEGLGISSNFLTAPLVTSALVEVTGLRRDHFLRQIQWKEGIYQILAPAQMTASSPPLHAPQFNAQTLQSEFARARFIEYFSQEAGFSPIQRVFRAVVIPGLSCDSSQQRRALYPWYAPAAASGTLERWAKEMPWFYQSAAAVPAPITSAPPAVSRRPSTWDDVLISLIGTGEVGLLLISLGLLSADTATSPSR